MKKCAILLLLSLFLLFSCMSLEIDNTDTIDFYLTDAAGSQSTIFSRGESFYMEFYLINNADSTLDYTVYDSGPAVRFSIYRDTTYVAGSMDGIGVRCAVYTYDLEPGDSISGKWLAPTTLHDPLLQLEAGQYSAKVSHPSDSGLDHKQVDDIFFTISEH